MRLVLTVTQVFTSSYDCSVRKLSFTSGISTEVFSLEDSLITSIDLPVTGNEMWISDSDGGITHLDLREDRSKARWYQLSDQKVGSVSINPTAPHYLVTASNSRTMKYVSQTNETVSGSLMNGQNMGRSQVTKHPPWIKERGRESQRFRSGPCQRLSRVTKGEGLPSCGMEARQVRQCRILGSSRKIHSQHKLR